MTKRAPPSGRFDAAMKPPWARAQEVLRAGGSDLAHTVRCDQFVRDWRAVPSFHESRRRGGINAAWLSGQYSTIRSPRLADAALGLTD